MKFNMLFLPGRLSDTTITSYPLENGRYLVHGSAVFGGVCVQGENEMRCIRTAITKLNEMKQKKEPFS